jgi:hypothetical protein
MNKHIDLSAQYGCKATMTVVDTVIMGIPHRLRRFWREDLPTSGKVEMYTMCPGEDHSSVTAEDWLGYAVAGTKQGDAAIKAVRQVIEGRAEDLLGREQAARYAAIEML